MRQAEFHLTYFQLGLLPAMFMVGLMLACAASSKMSSYISSFRLVGMSPAPHICMPGTAIIPHMIAGVRSGHLCKSSAPFLAWLLMTLSAQSTSVSQVGRRAERVCG